MATVSRCVLPTFRRTSALVIHPAHVHVAFKVTLGAMFCYILYSAIDWTGIHSAFITCTFIALESTEATLYKGTLRIVGCIIGGALAFFSLVAIV